MDQSTNTGPATHFHRNGQDGGILPPYSGEETACSKCSNSEAYTRYRPVQTLMLVAEWNGQPERRGPLPERLERECKNCDFKWDEDLCPPGCGMTVEALAHAIDNATPYPVELAPEVCTYVARYLLDCLHVSARTDHALWQYDAGRPPEPKEPTPAEPHAATDSAPVTLQELADALCEAPQAPPAYALDLSPECARHMAEEIWKTYELTRRHSLTVDGEGAT